MTKSLSYPILQIPHRLHSNMSQIHQTTIIGRKEAAENTLEVSVKRPHNFSFDPGQYIQLGVPELLYSDYRGTSRQFSIASSPFDLEKISVVFRESGSGFKRTLKELPINAPVIIDGPHGFYTLPEQSDNPFILIAGGIGITPYLSMARSFEKKHLNFPIRLLYGNRNRESAAYLEELISIASRVKNFSVRSVFGRIDREFILQNVGVNNLQHFTWYIAGPPAMVTSVRSTLSLLKVSDEEIFTEEFTGYE